MCTPDSRDIGVLERNSASVVVLMFSVHSRQLEATQHRGAQENFALFPIIMSIININFLFCFLGD